MRFKLQAKRMRELFGYGWSALRQEGFAATFRRAAGFCRRRFGSKKGRFLPPKAVLAAQRAEDTSAWPVVSICVPLYNTPPRFLHELLDSVTAQTCRNWQLCCADASDAQHADVGETVRRYAAQDPAGRIRYCKVKNEGISANTNAAARLASGEYLALADHDDVLAPHAVYEMSRRAHESGAQWLYSDEALFSKSILRPIVGHFKPDFAPDYLNCCNYICHLSVFCRALFWQLGGLDPACDGSQDHDLFLRLSEVTTPVHLPYVLYYWRVHAGSTSGGTEAKP